MYVLMLHSIQPQVYTMPERALISKELAVLLGVLAHPHRIRIIEELRSGELDVNTLQAELNVSHSRVSQHLSLLKAHRLVVERREGRHVYYHLQQPDLAAWLLQGLQFIAADLAHTAEVRSALEKARERWSQPQEAALSTQSGT